MIEDLLKLVRSEIIDLVPYSSARREYAGGGIYMNANENPYHKESHETINRYPEPQPELLRQRLAELYQVDEKQILMTRGSDEGIDLWLRAFCSAGKDAIMICPPTYDMYGLSAQIQGASILSVPLNSGDFSLDLDGIRKAWRPECKLIFLCSPNNPTANSYAEQEILKLCEEFKDKAFVIVDEAYIEFSSQPSMSQHLSQYNNLAVLRTLSKAYGMAGARCGVILAHPKVIHVLSKVISPYPLATPVIDIILKELQDEHLIDVKNQIALLKQAREQMIAFLNQLPYVINVWPSETNFILAKVRDANAIIDHCAKHNIIIRNRSHMFHLENCIRISLGLEEENLLLQNVLERYEQN